MDERKTKHHVTKVQINFYSEIFNFSQHQAEALNIERDKYK